LQDLVGKVAFITGGGSGVGLGQAKVLAEEAGMKVALVDVQQLRLDEAMAYFSGKDVTVHPVLLDIADRAAFARVADEVELTLGPVHYLMNTAGVSHRGPIQDATYDDWDWHLNVNLFGVINGVKTFLPRMIAHGQGGHIVNTASMSAFLAWPTAGIYTTTKFAVRGFSEALRTDLARHGIGVSCLCPGAVNTNIHEAALSRPSKYKDTEYQGTDPESIASMKALIQDGFDPVDLARVTLAAMRRGEFWIIPYPEFLADIDRGNAELHDSIAAWSDDPDYLRRMKLRNPTSSSGHPMPTMSR
jgi:NAD(P)-dependent dehydrogenase (short-subunit alcohol dehydrogenase family)